MRVTEDKGLSLGGGLTKQCHDTHGPRAYILPSIVHPASPLDAISLAREY